MKIEVHIIGFGTQIHDVTNDPQFNCILDRHYDKFGQLEGGTVITAGRVSGHVDRAGHPGVEGVPGIPENRGVQCAPSRNSILGVQGKVGIVG